jgi:N-acetylmuramoyl-L-alanine amidase
MGALTPGVLDEGHVVERRGRRWTEQDLAVRYAVALEEELRRRGVQTALTRQDGRTGKNACPTGADLVIGLHFLASKDGRQRGFEVAAEGTFGLAWGVWDALGVLLPWRMGPRWVFSKECLSPLLEIRVGHMTSEEDMQLITDDLWKLRFAEGVAGAVVKHFAARVAA